MKRTMKKVVAMALAMVMMLAMAITASAANVTIKDDKNTGLLDGHTFKAYQVFKGTQSTEASNLGDIVWGGGINKENFLDKLQGDDLLKDDFPDEDFKIEDTLLALKIAKKIESYDNARAVRFAQIAYECRKGEGTSISVGNDYNLETGYYLIVDETENVPINNASLLQIAGRDDIEIEVKVNQPDVEKSVSEKDTVVDDYSIGDDVPFIITSKVPNMTQYQSYDYLFTDAMSEGLTFDISTLNVTITRKGIDGVDDTTKAVVSGGTPTEEYTQYITVTENANKDGFTLDMDLKINLAEEDGRTAQPDFQEGDEITITYSAKLNAKAVMGIGMPAEGEDSVTEPGNYNKVSLKYSSNPNEENAFTTTPDKIVRVYSFGMDISKIDAEENADKTHDALSGAKFKLYRVKEVQGDGETETTANEYVTALGANGSYKVTGWSLEDNEASELEVSADETTLGKLLLEGLEAGIYYLEEIKAPDGYNKLQKPVKIEIIATYEESEGKPTMVLDTLTYKQDDAVTAVDGDTATGLISFNVVNNKGALLPETGKLGTKLIYLAGIFAIAGGIFYFASRSKKKERR